MPAYVLWCTLGLALYLLSARSGGASQNRILFLAIAPGVAVNVFFGQNGFLTAALMIGGLANLDRRPIFSGILFGLLTIKPQFGLLLPVLLVTTGRWRVIAAAAATTMALVAVVSIWFGPDVWLDFVQKVLPQQRNLIVDAGDFGWPMVSSAFVNARRIGLSSDLAWAVQAVFSFAAFAAVVWTFRRRRDPVLSLALFIVATFLFSPWMLNYDMVVFGWIVALLRDRKDNTKIDHALALALWALPLIMMPLGVADIPAAMLVLPAFAARLIWRLARGEAQQTASGEADGAPIAWLVAQE
jgi:alpha-1,2-mannosyltransferase